MCVALQIFMKIEKALTVIHTLRLGETTMGETVLLQF